MQIITSMHQDSTTEQLGIKQFNSQITDIVEQVITKIETCEKELQMQQTDIIKLFASKPTDLNESAMSKPGTNMTYYTDTFNNMSQMKKRPMTQSSNVIPQKSNL